MTIKKYILPLALLTTVYTPAFSNPQSQQPHKIILAEADAWFNNQGETTPPSSEEKSANIKSSASSPEINFDNYTIFQAKADTGDPVAQYQMALFLYHLKNRGVERSREMEQYALASANKGNADAQALLAVLFEGDNTDSGYAKALTWAQKAADQKNAAGLFILGYLYDKGHGVIQDKTKAMDLYKQSYSQGGSESALAIAYLYYHGEGVAVDYPEAIAWQTKAADAGNRKAQQELAFEYLKGKVVAQNNELADKYFEKAALQGNADDQFNYGVFNEIAKKDLTKAAYWYNKSALQGQSEAEFKFGLMNLFGAAKLQKNTETGLSWIQKSAEQGNANAQNFLGLYYSKIKEGTKDPVQAYAWFITAQTNGYPNVAETIAQIEKTLSPEQISQAKTLVEEYAKYKKQGE